MADIPAEAVRLALAARRRALIDDPTPTHLSDERLTEIMLEAAAPAILAAIRVTDEMVDRACHALWWNVDIPSSQPYSARARNFVRMLDEYSDEEKLPGGQRSRDLDRFQAAEREAEQMSREVMRRTLEAALSPPVMQEDDSRG